MCNQFRKVKRPNHLAMNSSSAKASKSSPFLVAIRVVTRGLFPDYVRRNVERNIRTCHQAGFYNFIIEVVTDIPQCLPKCSKTGATIREIVVPPNYQTKNGTLYKARALQYCLEEGVNQLKDTDWIVHLDEETLLTESSVWGILNFCTIGAHSFGAGDVTYGNRTVVNWWITMTENIRCAEDVMFQFIFEYIGRPLLAVKGSFIIAQVGPERKVSFDFGPEGSIAEDAFFAMAADRDGYKFGYVEGEMWEQSPFTLWDRMKQLKRWYQGVYLLHFCSSKHIPWTLCKLCHVVCQFSWTLSPLHFLLC